MEEHTPTTGEESGERYRRIAACLSVYESLGDLLSECLLPGLDRRRCKKRIRRLLAPVKRKGERGGTRQVLLEDYGGTGSTFLAELLGEAYRNGLPFSFSYDPISRGKLSSVSFSDGRFTVKVVPKAPPWRRRIRLKSFFSRRYLREKRKKIALLVRERERILDILLQKG